MVSGGVFFWTGEEIIVLYPLTDRPNVDVVLAHPPIQSPGVSRHLCLLLFVILGDVTYGYGSIPIDTIFSGMNIHKSQLFWCELQGYKVLTHCHIWQSYELLWNKLAPERYGFSLVLTVGATKPLAMNFSGYSNHVHSFLQTLSVGAQDIIYYIHIYSWYSLSTYFIIPSYTRMFIWLVVSNIFYFQ